MAKFSDRLGITNPPAELQTQNINDEFKNSIWNWLFDIVRNDAHYTVTVLRDFFKKPIGQTDSIPDISLPELHERFFRLKWYGVYNLAEFVLKGFFEYEETVRHARRIEENLNSILERELSGYRAIKGEIVPITEQSELEAIRQAADTTSSLGLNGPSQHILKALHLLGKKPEPDYRNSIKESISAVEGICKLLTGEKSGGIKIALEKLSSKAHLHESFKKSLLSLYGYTSDEAGIRHPILEEKDIGFPEAKFMLVTCSAFVNFLIDKARLAEML